MAPAHKEFEFVPVMVEIIGKYPDGCTMNQIISEIPNYIVLNAEDKSDSPSRAGEKKYQQIVRNVVSHKNKIFLEQVDIVKSKDKKPQNIFKIKSQAITSITERDTESNNEETFSSHQTNTKNAELSYDKNCELIDGCDRYDKKLMEQVLSSNFNGKPKTDSTLAEYIKNIHGYECLYTRLINGESKTFQSETGDDYIHAHHLIPIAAWKDFFPKSLDRPSNIVPLAPYYHDILHHGTKEAKRTILKDLYDAIKDNLLRDNLYVTFEQLMNYY